MLAMQYSFTLPSDYDMSVIERRVSEKGHALDHHAPLIFKAYLAAIAKDPVTASRENLYAPFYLWHDNDGMQGFLSSQGFAGLVASFGWPSIRTWPAVMAFERREDLSAATFATREFLPIVAYTDLAQLAAQESAAARQAMSDSNGLLALAAFEPTTWSMVRFRLWRDANDLIRSPSMQAYNVLHVSHPALNGNE